MSWWIGSGQCVWKLLTFYVRLCSSILFHLFLSRYYRSSFCYWCCCCYCGRRRVIYLLLSSSVALSFTYANAYAQKLTKKRLSCIQYANNTIESVFAVAKSETDSFYYSQKASEKCLLENSIYLWQNDNHDWHFYFGFGNYCIHEVLAEC